MRKLIIFGADTLASLAAFQLQKLHGQVVADFTVDDPYLNQPEFEGLPVVGINRVRFNCNHYHIRIS